MSGQRLPQLIATNTAIPCFRSSSTLPVSTKLIINAPANEPGRFVPRKVDGETGVRDRVELFA